jgi:hypothetical protein
LIKNGIKQVAHWFPTVLGFLGGQQIVKEDVNHLFIIGKLGHPSKHSLLTFLHGQNPIAKAIYRQQIKVHNLFKDWRVLPYGEIRA